MLYVDCIFAVNNHQKRTTLCYILLCLCNGCAGAVCRSAPGGWLSVWLGTGRRRTALASAGRRSGRESFSLRSSLWFRRMNREGAWASMVSTVFYFKNRAGRRLRKKSRQPENPHVYRPCINVAKW